MRAPFAPIKWRGIKNYQKDPVADELVETSRAKSVNLNMGYIRLSPFSPEAQADH